MVKKMNEKYIFDIKKKINEGMIITPEAFKIGEAAQLGMLYEVSTSPSPGLVSPNSQGAHKDMDFFTFLRSSASITHGITQCAQVGMDYCLKDILGLIRIVGIEAEKNMFIATEGVNTHRGFLFLGGVVAAAAGYCVQAKLPLDRRNIARICSEMCIGIVERELKSLDNSFKLTNGERLFLEYGLTGVRGEIEGGLQTVLKVGLPLYEEGLEENLPIKEALCHSLIGIMAEVEDTTVVNRCGMEGLIFMKKLSSMATEIGGMRTIEGKEFIFDLDKVFCDYNISPGGAADLLAITVMIHELEKKGGRV